MAARKGDRAELVGAQHGLKARVGERHLQHLRGQVGAGDDGHRGGGVERAAAPERDPAGRDQHHQQRQRIGQMGDRVGERAQRPVVGDELGQQGRVGVLRRVDPISDQRQPDQRAGAGDPGGEGGSDSLCHAKTVARQP